MRQEYYTIARTKFTPKIPLKPHTPYLDLQRVGQLLPLHGVAVGQLGAPRDAVHEAHRGDETALRAAQA